MSKPEHPPASSPAGVNRRQRVQSAETGIAILQALTRLGGSSSLGALAKAVDESSAKVHRYLLSFSEGGFVAQDAATLHYRLGPAAMAMGLAALRQCDPVRLGEASLVRLREQLQVTSFIAVMGNLGPAVLRIEEPSLPVTINIRAGSVLPMWRSATGRAFLAFSDKQSWRQIADQEPALTAAECGGRGRGDAAQRKLLQAIRGQGLAVVDGTLLRGVGAVAAPIFDAQGQVNAVITALGASEGVNLAADGAMCQQVAREAAVISAAQGYMAIVG